MKLIKLCFSVALSFSILSGCASFPDKVNVPEGTELVSFEEVKLSDSNLNGKTARWSGVIAGLSNKADKTQMDVLFYPSNRVGRPNTKDEPIGRFRAYIQGFLDPEVYKKGKSVVVLGQVADKETQKIDEYEYEYPTLDNATVHLWKKLKEAPKVEFYYGWYGNHPRWYWSGGVKHRYIIGGSQKPAASGVIKSTDKKQ